MRIRYISALLACGLLAGSCSTKYSLQKRRYGKGFYLASNHGSSKPSKNGSNNQSFDKPNTVEETPVPVEVVSAMPDQATSRGQTDQVANQGKTGVNQVPVTTKNVQLSAEKQHTTSKTTQELKFTDQKKSFKKRDNLGDILYSAYIGYYVVCLIFAIILLYTEVGLAATLLIIGITLAIFLVCYAIGSFFRGLFN